MQKHRTAGSHRDQNRATTTRKNKENPVADTVFLIQNENQVLRMKNNELNTKIKQLKMQLNGYTDSIALKEREVDGLKNQISSVCYKEDIQIENQKKLLTQKLVLLKSNEEIIARKIKEAREATIFEEQKIADVQHDRKSIEMEILIMRAQNEGTKIILRNLEQQNQKLRLQNETLISKRKIHEPKEKQVSIQIEQRIRLIKNQQQNLKSLRRYQTAKLVNGILSIIYAKKLKDYFTIIDRKGLLSKIAKKKMMQMALIRKKYLTFIKTSILQKLRSSFQPLVEQQAAKRIISETHKRRVKAFIWRKWRNAAKNAEFTTMRRFEVQNLLEKLGESFNKTNLFAAFNMVKYFRNDPFKEGGASKIEIIFNQFMNRSKTLFFSNLRAAQRSYQANLEIEASSNQQSKLLVRSLYFSAWAKIAKSRGIQNKSLKRRYFNELKKLIALKNRLKLGQMLVKTNQKINNIDTESKVFAQLKKDTAIAKLQSLKEQKISFEEKTVSLKEELDEMRNEKKQLYRQLALIKVSKYLKTKVQKAFDIWRLRQQQRKVLLSIINMVESKKACDKNFAFAQILKKRFAMLKKSIRDKIQSCEFSYNYLLEQNKHIKEVLDTKQHELEKSKFMNLLKKIIRNEKDIKLKYLYKFMRSGFKFWKFRKVCHRIDNMVTKKVKLVFFWILKEDKRQITQETRIESFVEGKERKINEKYCRKALKGFQMNRDRNRRFRRVIGGIFERNLQLDFFVAFGTIRNEQHLQNRAEIQADIDEVQKQIDNRQAITADEQNTIMILKNRLKQKEQILVQRKILGLYQFFVKNIKYKVGSYVRRWKDRVMRQKRVTQFAEILERKTRIMLKNKFMLSINKKNEDYTLDELQDKLAKFKHEYDHLAENQEKFIQQNEKDSQRMKTENVFFKREGEIHQKKTDFMTNIRLKSFAKEWGKKMLKFTFKEWRNQTDIFIDTWTQLNNYYTHKIIKETFDYLSKEMKQEVFNAKLRKKLDRIYTKKYRYNLAFGFQTWRLVYLNNSIRVWSQQQKKQMKRFQGLEAKYKHAVSYHNKLVDYRYYDPKIRTWWNNWRIYTQNKVYNNRNKQKLDGWLYRGYAAQFVRILKKKEAKKIEFKERLNNFKKKWQVKRLKSFMYQTLQNKNRRRRVIRLFINKFCPFMIHKTMQEFFTRVKNYGNNQIIIRKMQHTDKIQFFIGTFQKKRKGILNFYLRKWRRNEYEMRIAKNLMRRITRNAMNWRIKDSFFSWKLECQAKKVKQMHEEQGEVKKRKIEIGRLKIFLQDFKKEKGLLLEDDAGKFVMSPRFQEKKDQQIKKDNNLRYKFISRLILSMNGYAAPVKAWNNIKMYLLIREKYRKCAQFTRNMLRKPDLYSAFKTWHKASTEFNKMFQTMQRKDLIKILNKQKDKMQMQYSKKVSLQQKIQQEMRAHKVLSYQDDKKQKLCGHVFLKNLRKIRLYSLLTWKDRVREMKEVELGTLEEQGNNKINTLEQEVNDLDQIQRQLQQNNQKLEQAVREALQIAQMVKRITEQRDILSNLITQKQLTCESLQEQNEQLNAKLYQAQKQAMNLLILSGDRL